MYTALNFLNFGFAGPLEVAPSVDVGVTIIAPNSLSERKDCHEAEYEAFILHGGMWFFC